MSFMVLGVRFAALSLALLAPGLAAGQPIFSSTDSLELMVTDARTVVLGVISEVAEAPTEAEPLREVTLEVRETLKGEPRATRTVVAGEPRSVLTAWRDASRQLLVTISAQDSVPALLIDLADKDLAVLTTEFHVLQDAASVIDAARAEVRRMPGVIRIESFWLPVPQEALAGTKWEREAWGVKLRVPADDRLERRALDMIRSSSPSDREHGARALRHFKSEANIAVAMSLLDDPGQATLRDARNNRGLEVRSYWVRSAAYDTLRYWGVAVEEPLLREERWRPELVRVVSFDGARVSNEDLDELAAFENLEFLSMRRASVEDASLKRLAGLAKLQELAISDTTVTDEGLRHLAEIASLRYLDIRGTRATAEGVAELRRGRPDLHIDF